MTRWDALKAITTKLKKERETQYKSLLADLKQLEQKQRGNTKPQMKGEEPTE